MVSELVSEPLPISVVMITNNEERNVRDALESVSSAREIVVIDSMSTDNTVEICSNYTDKVFVRKWHGYARQKQMAVDLAAGPWVFVLDADERFTPKLAKEIGEMIANPTCNGYYVARKNFFLGKWIRHGAWWPDHTLRLFRKDSGHFEEREVHEKIVVKGKTGYLANPIEHHTYRTLSEFIIKMDNYSALSAREMAGNHKTTNVYCLTVKPIAAFLKMYFMRLGFLDGIRGFALAILYSVYTFLKYLKLWEMEKVDGN
ncbi:MAG: glycosyltransferase family 2 protein [Nitrospirae bacterium]|nr:glycosyltransferase family 2 protein [Nitrospirota bacterium]